MTTQSLRDKLAKYNAAVERLDAQIAQLRRDRIATDGARQALQALVDEDEKAEAEATAPDAPASDAPTAPDVPAPATPTSPPDSEFSPS